MTAWMAYLLGAVGAALIVVLLVAIGFATWRDLRG